MNRVSSAGVQTVIRVAAAFAVCACPSIRAQTLLPVTEGIARPIYTDVAILEAQETRKEIPCVVTPVKPTLGFDLKFHAGYDVSVPLKSLEGDGNLLTMIFRVAPAAKLDDPIYLSQRINVPEIEADAKGEAFLDGSFSLGEGKYHVSWLMRDRAERICSSNWDIEATVPGRDRQMMNMEIAPGDVQPPDRELFKPEPASAKDPQGSPVRLKVLVNFAPQDAASAVMQPADKEGLVSILRNIARDPHIGEFSLVAFNLQDERVIFRQEQASQMDFPGLGVALEPIVFGTVKLHQLVEKHSEAEFLGALLTKEVGGAQDKFDAVVIAGPKVMTDDSVPAESLKQLSDLKIPVAYLNYLPNPTANPWRDAIAGAVRFAKGVEYTISRPRDLVSAWTEIMGRIMKLKSGRTVASGPASQ